MDLESDDGPWDFSGNEHLEEDLHSVSERTIRNGAFGWFNQI